MKNKVLKILLSVFIAFGLWLYVVTEERTEIEQTFYNIPVIMDGESILAERGLKIASDTDLTVSLKLNGKRSDLNRLRSSDITVLVDLSRISEAGEKSLPYTVSFPGDVQNNAIEVVDRRPATIHVTVAQWETKGIPVQLDMTGVLPENFIVDRNNVELEHEEVSISGPREVVDQIAMAKVVVDMGGRTESVEQRVNIILCDDKGEPVVDVSSVTPDPYRVLVKIPVLMVKDITLKVPIVDGGGLTAEDVGLTMDYETITVSGPASVISKMSDVVTLGTIDLSKETESFVDREYPVKLPEGVRNTTGVDTVKVSLTLPEMKTRSFTLELDKDDLAQISFIGQPTGVPVSLKMPQRFRVWIRGREAALDKVMVEDIRLVVDLTGATQSGYYPVTVEVDNISGVGVVPDQSDPSAAYELFVLIGTPKPVIPEG